MNIINKYLSLLKEFWQRKTFFFSLLRIFILLTILLPIINFILVETRLMPEGLTPILPKKCQEVTSAYTFPQTHCYTLFDKKYWSIEKWSSVSEPLDPNALPPGHYGTMEHPSI